MSRAVGSWSGTYTLRDRDVPNELLYCPDRAYPLTYTAADGRQYRMDEPFSTDFATTGPLGVLPWFKPMAWKKAAVLHDWLWELRRTGRHQANFFESNRLLQEAIVALGHARWVAWVCWFGCTVFGWLWWLRGERSAVRVKE